MDHSTSYPTFDNGHKIGLLYEEVGGYIKDIVHKFLNTLPERLARLSHAMKTEDLFLLQTEAHKLKGAAATLGAEQMTHLCYQLEQICLTGHTPPPALLTSLIDNAQLVTQLLTESVEHLTSQHNHPPI